MTGLALEDGAILQLVVQGEGFRVGDRASGEDAEVWTVGVVDDSGNAVGVTRVVDEPCDSSLGLCVNEERASGELVDVCVGWPGGGFDALESSETLRLVDDFTPVLSDVDVATGGGAWCGSESPAESSAASVVDFVLSCVVVCLAVETGGRFASIVVASA